MELKKEYGLECLPLPISTKCQLDYSGIVNVGDFINSDIDEIINSGLHDEQGVEYIIRCRQQMANGEIKILGHYLHRDFEAGADMGGKYFRHKDGLRYQDKALKEIIDDEHDLKELKDSGFSLLSQLIGFKTSDYKASTKLEAKNRAKVMKMIAKVDLVPATTPDPVESSMGERLFYKIWNCLNELVGVELVNHYKETIDLYDDYIANNGDDYNLLECYNDKKLGSYLFKERCFQEIMQRYMFKLLKSHQYGLSFEEISAMVPVLFQDSSELGGYMNTLIDQQLISQLIPGHFVAGAPDLISGISRLGSVKFVMEKQ